MRLIRLVGLLRIIRLLRFNGLLRLARLLRGRGTGGGMGLHAAAVQSIEYGGGVISHIPDHLAVEEDGLAVGKGAGSSLDLAGGAVHAVVEIAEGVPDGGAVLLVPQQVAALQSGRGQDRCCAGGSVERIPSAGAFGLVHILEVNGPVAAASAGAVVAVGHHIAVGGFLQAAHGGAGGVVPGGASKGKQILVPAPVPIGAGEFAGAGIGVVAHQDCAPRIGVAVIQGDDFAVLIHQDELVEGVGHIAIGYVHHVIVSVRDGHVALPYCHGQIGLVIEAVIAGVHLVAGADIQVAAVLVTPQAACVEGDHRVGSLQAGLPQPLPIL